MGNHVGLTAEQSREGVSSTAAHTLGPWRLVQGDIHDHSEDGEVDGFTILMGDYARGGGLAIHHLQYAEGIYPEDREHAEAEANARLIAAAPDLLAACKACMDNKGDWGALMCAAIAKATGAA